MSETSMPQSDADSLFKMQKFKKTGDIWMLPAMGGSLSIPLISLDRREEFILDISRGRIDLLKGKCQNRARQNAVLVRLDFGGPPHRNPDDAEIPSPHLHVYREGYGDKWAEPVSPSHFPNPADRWATIQDFMKFCNIVEPPLIEQGLS